MAAAITPEHPASPEATALIAELDAHLTPLYPTESRHGFSVQKLIADAVAFFVIRDDGAPAGCGGIKRFGTVYGEIKRKWVRPELLDDLAAYARAHDVHILTFGDRHPSARRRPVIRTGGLQAIPPFGPYRDDPVSRCYEKLIQ